MALTATTAAAAIGIDDVEVKLASITGLLKGMYLRCDGEVMQALVDAVSTSIPVKVARGVEGTINQAHPISAKVIFGTGLDFPSNTPGIEEPTPFPPQVTLPPYSYSASGALLAKQGLHYLNGTGALAMTLASPTTLQDGQIMAIVGNGKAAHTVTYAAGLGNASTGYTVMTFDALGQCCLALIAAGGIWVPFPSPLSGTLTAIDVAVA